MSEYYSPLSSDGENFVDFDANGNDNDNGDDSGDFDRNLPETVTLLHSPLNESTVYLIGTAHFSEQSQNDVIRVIQSVQPHIVVVELCPSRIHIMEVDEKYLKKEAENLNFTKMLNIIKQNGPINGIVMIMFLTITAQLVNQFGMAPGGEFRVALAEAKKIPGCVIKMGDRPIQVTIKRALAKLSWWQTLKLVFQMGFFNEVISKEEMESYKNKDILEELISRMTKEYPVLKSVFVDERDTFLTHSIQIATLSHNLLNLHQREPIRVVAVMGMGHVPGIIKNWPIVQEPCIRSIMIIPDTAVSTKVIRFTVKATFIALGCYMIYKITPIKSSLSMITYAFTKITKKCDF